jgi:hypothetical protein
MRAGAIVAGLAWLPLLLYGVFGPAKGNPIGLGLLAVLGTVIAVVTVLTGAALTAVDRFRGRDA